jgi:hypothetical protein
MDIITREIITTIHRRNRAHKKLKTTPSLERSTKYLKLRKECQKMTRQAHKDYTDSLFDQENAEDKATITKKFWTYVKSKKKDNCSISPLRSEGLLISDSKGKANILNKQYCSVFQVEDQENIPYTGPSTAPQLPSIIVTEKGVGLLKLLQSLNTHKATGPDGISRMVLRN